MGLLKIVTVLLHTTKCTALALRCLMQQSSETGPATIEREEFPWSHQQVLHYVPEPLLPIWLVEQKGTVT